jgi:hypothetical protein
MVRNTIAVLFVLSLFAGCESDEVTATANVAEPAAAGAGTTAAHAGKSGKSGNCARDAEPHAGGCGGECDDATSEIQHAGVETRTLEDGTQVTHVGAALTGADEVALPELLDNPAAYRGKMVRVRGDVSAMCHHKRAWFALTAGDKTGRHVRIFAAPKFLVPHGSIGRTAVTEGTVDVVEVPAARAKHLASEHKLDDPAAVRGPVQQVVIRASGADFS